MVSLLDGEKISKISLFVLAQLTNVTNERTDGQTPGDSINRAYAYASRGNNWETVEDRWVHAARGLASTELSFHSCNVLRDCRRGVPRANKQEVLTSCLFALGQIRQN